MIEKNVINNLVLQGDDKAVLDKTPSEQFANVNCKNGAQIINIIPENNRKFLLIKVTIK